jgi:hypothetical protein
LDIVNFLSIGKGYFALHNPAPDANTGWWGFLKPILFFIDGPTEIASLLKFGSR